MIAFRSRISWLLVALIIFLNVLILVQTISTSELWANILSVVIPDFIFIVLVFGMRYIIDGNILYVRTFPMTKGKSYDLAKLVSIEPTRSMKSAPASSLRRIALDFGCGDKLIISPANQEYFIDLIREVNPQVKVMM